MSRESIAAQIATIAVDLINNLRQANLKYKKETEEIEHNLSTRQAISSEEINQKIKILQQQFEQEIEQREHDFQVKIEKKKQKADLEVKNYQRFLESIEDMREKLEEFYPEIPLPLILVIHEYATHLLHKMWETSDVRERLKHQKKFVQFLSLVSQDTNPGHLQGNLDNSPILPHRTLKYIQEESK